MKSIEVKRIGAFTIDLILVAVLIIVFEILIPDLFQDYTMDLFDMTLKLNVSLHYFLYLPYFLFFDFVTRGNSLGKMIFELRVCNKEGEFLELPIRILRTMVKMISISVLPLSIIVYFLFNGYTLQDLLMKTKVESSTA